MKQFVEHTNKIHHITLRDIEESKELRLSLLDQHEGKHILNNKTIMEIQKAYAGSAAGAAADYARNLDRVQSYAQSDEKKQADRLDEVRKHNLELLDEYKRGEEGVDYIPDAWKKDPRVADFA